MLPLLRNLKRLRDLLTIVASFLILVLTLALVGPWFVDWTARRGWVESELSRMTGARVRVDGAIDLKLLPIPSLALKGVHVSSSQGDGPVLDVASVRLELAAASMLRGELHFTDADLVRPQLTLSGYDGGAIMMPHMPDFAPSGVQIERLNIRDGSLAIRAEGTSPTVIGGLDFTGEATSLAGPFKGSGSWLIADAPVKFRFTTSQIEGNRLRMKLIVDESGLGPRADLEGELSLIANGPGVLPVFVGMAAFSARDTLAGAPVPWRLSGAFKADTTRAGFEAADLRAGDEDRAVTATGTAALSFSPMLRLDAQFVARQLDFDRLLAGGDKATSAGQRLAALFAGAVADASVPDRIPFPLAVSITSPTATLAGETLTELRAALALESGQLPHVKLAVQGPARSALSMDGSVETGSAAAFRGRMDLSSRDLRRLSDWLALSLPDEARRLRDLPFRSLDLAGDVEISAAGVFVDKLALRLDRSQFAGAMSFNRATQQTAPRLFANLTSDALDLEGLPELAGPARLAADMDLSLTLDAWGVRLERFGAGYVNAGRIGLELVKDASGTQLKKFTIENIGGANVFATGHFGAGNVKVDALLDAARLGDLAALVQRVAPGPWADALAKRATALSPARLTLEARGNGTDALGDIKIEGTARGSKVGLQSKGDLNVLDVKASAESADAVMLLRQFGFETLPLPGLGAGRVTLSAKGSRGDGFETAIVAHAGRSEMGFDGRIDPDKANWRGKLRLRSPDAGPLLRALAIALPDAQAGLPADGSAQAEQVGGVLTFSNLSGLVSGVFVNGALRGVPDGEGRRWSGDLKLDRLALADLSALVLGPQRVPARGAVWSDQAFGPGLAEPPRIDLGMTATAFDLTDALNARDATFDLHIAPGSVVLDNARMTLGAGKLSGGQIAFRRDGSGASLAGKVDLENISAPSGPVWGSMTGHLEFTSTGQSPLALAGGLAGGGTIKMNPLTFTGADPLAITRLIEAADAGKVNIDDVEMRGRLLREFEAAPLQMDTKSFDASIAAGVVRLASTDEPRVEMSWDLRQPGISARVDLTAPRMPKEWTGGAPAATLVWQGKPGAIQRSTDAGPLFNAISVRAIARAAARVQALDADIRERASFNRRAKTFEFIRRRDREVVIYLDEQRRAEEASQALQPPQPPPPPPPPQQAPLPPPVQPPQPPPRPALPGDFGPVPGGLLPMPRPSFEDPLASGRY